MNHNNLTVSAFSRDGATAYAYSLTKDATGVRFSTQSPGGLYGGASFFVPWDITEEWPVALGARIRIANGLDKTVWEGALTAIEIAAQGGRSGYACQCAGYWAYLLMRQNIRKMWADSRLDNEAWYQSPTAYNADDVTPQEVVKIDRSNRIRFAPDAVAFATNQYARVTYSAPTGQTVKRVTFNYDLQEGSQTWLAGLVNQDSGAAGWSATSSGTGAVDHTLGTPSQSVWLYIQAGANQTPPRGTAGTIYAEFSSVVVYTETGTITGQTVAGYIATALADLSSSTAAIGTLSTDLAPHFGAERPTPYADVLMSAASYGDSANNTWSPSIIAADPNGDNKPRLSLSALPPLNTGTPEYVISLDGRSITDSLRITRTIDDVVNYVTVEYQDAEGRTRYITPDDDATFKSTTSIAQYGQLEPRGPLTADTSGTALLSIYARGYIYRYADYTPLQWKVSGGLAVRGYIRTPSGQRVPASEIQAGKRVKVENFLEDISGSGLTFIITGTDYDDSAETCTISVGRPDELSAWLARQVKGR